MNMEYWIGVVNVLIPASFTVTILGAFATAFLLMEFYVPVTKTDLSTLKISVVVATVITILFFLLWVFVPSADAIRAMYI